MAQAEIKSCLSMGFLIGDMPHFWVVENNRVKVWCYKSKNFLLIKEFLIILIFRVKDINKEQFINNKYVYKKKKLDILIKIKILSA